MLNNASIPSFTFSIDLMGAGNGAVVVTPGFVCTSSCSHNYASRANLTLSPKPNPGSTFSGWHGGGCSGTGSCNLTISTNTSVTATFDLTPDFQLSASALSPGTVTPGQSTTSTINVTAIGTFNTSVALTCSVSPTPQMAPQCSISPSSVNPGTPATLTVNTTAASAGLTPASRLSLFYAVWFPVLGFMFLCRRRAPVCNRLLLYVLFATCMFALCSTQVACGGGGSTSGGGNSGTPPANYTITIKGSSAATQHTTSVTLMVQ